MDLLLCILHMWIRLELLFSAMHTFQLGFNNNLRWTYKGTVSSVELIILPFVNFSIVNSLSCC